jgi:hypothetical protein
MVVHKNAKYEAFKFIKYLSDDLGEEKYKLNHKKIKDSALLDDEVKKKMKETCLIKYGGSPMQNKDIQQKSINTNLQKYGVAYPAQNMDIFEKTQHSLKKYKKYKMPSGEIRNIQGYEHYAIDNLLKIYTEEQIKTERKDIPRISYNYNNKTKYYFPDIFIPHENKIIEVKSKWIYDLQHDINNTKAEYTKTAGYNFEFWIFDKNGKIINELI